MPKATSEKKKGKTGRPKKFGRPSKAFYLVLPDDVVAKLRSVDPDMATAIVKVIEGTDFNGSVPLVEPVSLAPDRHLIWVGEIGALHHWPGIILHKVEPMRYLLILDRDYDVRSFELDLLDCLAADRADAVDRPGLKQLTEVLRQMRLERHALIETTILQG